MKPCNFPGRKHQRRIDALSRLDNFWLGLINTGHAKGLSAVAKSERAALVERITNPGPRFTKKNRSARGKRKE